jgi:hypothetical protein
MTDIGDLVEVDRLIENGASWRSIAKATIARVIAENPGAGGAELKKLLQKAYPFGERRNHPYKIWCDEAKRTLHDLSIAGNLRNFWTK